MGGSKVKYIDWDAKEKKDKKKLRPKKSIQKLFK